MNKKIGMIGAIINAISVFLFALCVMINFMTGSFFVSISIALSFIIMIAAFENECSNDSKVAGKIALILSSIYATIAMIVYFTQCTSILYDELSPEALKILDFKNMGLIVNIDFLGYGIMSLAAFFIGLTINIKNKKDKILKALFLIHGIFFIGCIILPMTGITSQSSEGSSMGGMIGMGIWGLYFMTISILSYRHFKEA